ncbi:MAG: hypothetical protein R2801_02440 [Chitinophagales bacterium]
MKKATIFLISLMTILAISCKKEETTTGTCKIVKTISNGNESNFEYDDQDRIISTYSNYATISYTGNTSLKIIKDEDGTIVSRTTTTRNTNGYITNIYYEKQNPTATYDIRNTNWAYQYNGNQVISAVYTTNFQNGASEKYNYTYTWSNGNMIKEVHKEVGNSNAYTYTTEYEYTDILMQKRAGYFWENTQYGTGLPIMQTKHLIKSATSYSSSASPNKVLLLMILFR